MARRIWAGQYVEDKAEEYSLEIPNEDKLVGIFTELLDEFSVSEIWYMISTAYMNAAAFYQSGKATGRKHASNTVPSKIVQLSEQPRSRIRQWTRTKERPRCALTEALFDRMLGVEGDAGFNLSPGKTWNALLERHLTRQPAQEDEGMELLERHHLPSDDILVQLAAEQDDETIARIISFAIEARRHVRRQVQF